jgi:hypothetical protein
MKIFGLNILTDEQLKNKLSRTEKEIDDYIKTMELELYREIQRCGENMNKRYTEHYLQNIKDSNKIQELIKENKLLKSRKKNIIVNMN